MNKLNKLISKSKFSVSIFVNDHRDYYETIEEYIGEEDMLFIDKDILGKMIDLDTCVKIVFYPDTAISNYIVYHYDLEKAVDLALSLFNVNLN